MVFLFKLNLSLPDYVIRVMTQTDAKSLAIELMDKWGLLDSGWDFIFDNRRRAFGGCQYLKGRKKSGTIRLSKYLLPTLSEDQVKDTILHEIAHALDVMDRGTSDHSYQWQRWAIKVGANPSGGKKPTFEENAKPSKYTATCPNGHTHAVHRKWSPRIRRSCETCYPSDFNPEFEYKLIQNY
jgi:predicted SprT family Zn-dependent metalloprotease